MLFCHGYFVSFLFKFYLYAKSIKLLIVAVQNCLINEPVIYLSLTGNSGTVDRECSGNVRPAWNLHRRYCSEDGAS